MVEAPPTLACPEVDHFMRRALARDLWLSAGAFVSAFVLAMLCVLNEPLLAFDVIPRVLLLQIDPLAWGERSHAAADVGMTLFYWANNLRVSLLALGLGLAGGVLALGAVAYNGALWGTILGTALERGVADRLLAWMAPHGVPEMAALVICGGLGMALGRAWLNPGRRGRIEAVRHTGRAGFKPLLVALALIVVAAPLEGFVAPLSMPWPLDAGIAAAWVVGLGMLARHWLR